MTNWYSTIYKACIYASIVAFIIGFFTSSSASLGAYLAGYSALILGIMLILIILFTNVLKATANNSSLQILYSIFITSGPFILMLGVISFVLYSLIQYKNNIIEGHIAPGYNSFSNIIIILLMIQLYLVINNINTENFERTGKMSKVTSSIIYLLGVLTAISSIILYTILKYYSTDGFTVN
jgi:hypothetical protein